MRDLKSLDLTVVWVRIPSGALECHSNLCCHIFALICVVMVPSNKKVINRLFPGFMVRLVELYDNRSDKPYNTQLLFFCNGSSQKQDPVNYEWRLDKVGSFDIVKYSSVPMIVVCSNPDRCVYWSESKFRNEYQDAFNYSRYYRKELPYRFDKPFMYPPEEGTIF